VDNFLEGKGREESPGYHFDGEYHTGAKTFGKLTWDLEKHTPSVYEGAFFDETFNG
jgi:hypothetical protein